MQESLIEKRASVRIPATIPIQYETPTGWAPLGETFNLSEGGIGVKLKTNIKPSSSIRWRSTDDQIKALGRIAWTDEPHHLCGIQFTEIDLSSRNRLEQKLRLDPSFIEYKLSDLKTDDQKILNFFKEDVYTSIKSLNEVLLFDSLSSDQAKQNKINNILDSLVQKADITTSTITRKPLLSQTEKIFRQLIGPWIYQSEIMKRATEKPRGYAGDYVMLERVYNNKYISSLDGKYFDHYFLENPYAIAVRNRKNQMKEILNSIASKAQKDLRILNIACGSCREIKEFLPLAEKIKGRLNFSLVDHDQEALNFAKNALSQHPGNINFNFIQESILSFVKKPEYYVKELGSFDLIYSIGLADYLPDKIFKALLSFLLSLLSKEGSLIFAHKDIDQYKPLPPNWYCDWHFVSRNEPDVISLVKEASPFPINISINRELSKKIFFLYINKSTL